MPHPQGAEGDPDNRALFLSAAPPAAQQARPRAGPCVRAQPLCMRRPALHTRADTAEGPQLICGCHRLRAAVKVTGAA